MCDCVRRRCRHFPHYAYFHILSAAIEIEASQAKCEKSGVDRIHYFQFQCIKYNFRLFFSGFVSRQWCVAGASPLSGGCQVVHLCNQSCTSSPIRQKRHRCALLELIEFCTEGKSTLRQAISDDDWWKFQSQTRPSINYAMANWYPTCELASAKWRP